MLVVITGAPGTGKTTLGRRLGQELGLPYYSKDTFKEALFDSLGWSDLAWSRKVGVASIGLLFVVAEAQLAAGRSVILESNLRPDFDTPRFLDLLGWHACEPFQIYCRAEPETLLRRFADRWNAGDRHPGHVEAEQIAGFAATHLTPGAYAPLAIGGRLSTLDTTDFASVDCAPLLADLRAALAEH
jgi:predicted kinase